jgi:peptidoglycan/xylan/chitin deacetylase (PgdA/CDA1 family)
MNLEKKYGAKSSFYFMTDGKYNTESLKDEIKNINEQGWEIRLHIGYHSYDNIKQIKKEKKKLEDILGKKVIGCRNHRLRFKIPDSWQTLEKAGFKYDSTLGYPDMVGFRNGLCHSFNPFDLETKKEINILEISLIIMDITLFKYLKLDIVKAWKITKLFIDIVAKYNGVITILWHNTRFSGQYRHFYKKILEYGHQKNAWLASAGEIWKFWRQEGPWK